MRARAAHLSLIALGRELMFDPFWALHAAGALMAELSVGLWEQQYGWAIARRAEIAAGQAR